MRRLWTKFVSWPRWNRLGLIISSTTVQAFAAGYAFRIFLIVDSPAIRIWYLLWCGVCLNTAIRRRNSSSGF